MSQIKHKLGKFVAEAEQMLAQGQIEPATRLLRQALAADPRSAAAHGLLAIALVMQGDAPAAIPHAESAVELRPEDARAWFTLGRAHKASGDPVQAATAYRRAIVANPGYAEAYVSLGIALSAQNELDEAIAAYQRAIELKPGLSVAHANLANASAARAERDILAGNDAAPDALALAAQARAVELDRGNATLQRNYGMLLSRAQKRMEAAEAFEHALALDNHDVESCLRLADCLRSLGDTVLARELFEKFMSLNPPSAAVMRAFSSWLTRGGFVDEALEWGRKAVALDPDPQTLVQMCGALLQARRQAEALAMGRRAVDTSNNHFNFYPVLLLGTNYLSEDPREVIGVHAEFGRQLPPPQRQRPVWRARQPGEKLKVGYVSGDFIRHSVSSFIGGLFEQHDRDLFEVYLYHNRGYSDSVTEHFKSLGHHWFDCDGLSDEALYRQITADGIDILVDLAGHTENSRVFLFAMAPAPVQVAYLGYPTVSGVPATQFRITDAVIDPPEEAAEQRALLASDQPLLLPRTMFCFRPDDAPAIGPPPSMRNGHVTFGSFNNIAKVTEHTLALWASALNAVPGSRLMLKSGAMAQASNRQSIERVMADCGISADRLTLTAWIADKGGHLNLYNEIDIALDPYPYNGATTTCEALWMGVPVITRRGGTHTSRMGASILRAVGHTAWIADDDEAYACIAGTVARDDEGRALWREQSRDLLPRSELFDEAGFVRDFERVLMRAWAQAVEMEHVIPT
jgi:predicted O-linked N-acetylglucosamine transferase (SPINDLY family)